MARSAGRHDPDSQLAAPPTLECYAPGVGELAERVVMGHHEEFQLVQVTHQTLLGREGPRGFPVYPGLENQGLSPRCISPRCRLT
jgi:hypothetical protein